MQSIQRADRIYILQLRSWLCHPTDHDIDFLRPCHHQAENSGPKKQVEREEKIAQESYPPGLNCDYRLHTLLATLLDYSGKIITTNFYVTAVPTKLLHKFPPKL